MNQWKSAHAVETRARTLVEAMEGADVVLRPVGEGRADAGHGAPHGRRSRSSSPWPTPTRRSRRRRRARPARRDHRHRAAATIRTRSTTCSASPTSSAARWTCARSTINEAMKIAAAEALAKLAREDVPDEVRTAAAGGALTFGPEYIIPNAFDPRLIAWIPPAVAKAAMDSGVARRRLSRPAQIRARAVRPARSDGERAGRDHGERARPPQARGVRRGRGGEGRARGGRVPQRGLRHAGADRARGSRAGDDDSARPAADTTASRSTTRGCRRTTSATRTSSTRACSAKASCSATASAWSTRTATSSPPAWWPPATRTRW